MVTLPFVFLSGANASRRRAQPSYSAGPQQLQLRL
jgi:hypothetical protein